MKTTSTRILLIVALFFGTILGGAAQYLEIGVNASAMRYYGDLSAGNFKPSGSLFLRYNCNPHLALRGQFTYGSFSGSDALAREERVRARNLSFDNQFFEISAVAELNFTGLDVMDGKTHAPYIFAGVGGFYHNPTANYQGTTYQLWKLKTEGVAYSSISMSFPVGLGLRWALGKRFNIGFEMAVRPTMTDYLDDVATTYPNLETMAETNPQAAILSYRTPEYYNFAVDAPSAGTRRGDKLKIDALYSIGINFSYNLASAKRMEYNSLYKTF
ncbi:MAG: hypothetical protein RL757_2412 [Bacteroidota bacterium]|jgi:hypothetical protein